jgi:hypothetical protein
MEQFIGNLPISHRIWKVYATIETDETISFVRMTWGAGERSFRPNEENDTVTKAGMAFVRAKQALDAIDFSKPAEAGDDDYDVIERFSE